MPNAEIHYATGEAASSIVKAQPTGIIDYIWFAERPWTQLRSFQFDRVYDLQDHDRWTNHLNALQTRRRAPGHPLMRFDREARLARAQRRLRYVDIYGEMLGVDVRGATLQLEPPEEARKDGTAIVQHARAAGRPVVALGLSSCWQTRDYGTGAMVILVRGLLSLGLTPIFLASDPGYRYSVKVPGMQNLAGRTSMLVAAEVIRQSDFFVGIDSLPMHFADWAGTPGVVVWNATEPRHVLTSGRFLRHIRTTVPCSPCFYERCPNAQECRRDIGPERVLAVMGELLGRDTHAASADTRTPERARRPPQISSSEPLLSVGVVGWDQGEMTRDLVRALFQAPFPIEVMIADNGSARATQTIYGDLERDFSGRLKIIRLGQNLGFTRAANVALQAGSAPVLMIINPDVEVGSSTWARAFLQAVASNPRALVGIEGRRLRDDLECIPRQSFDPDYVEGCCIAAFREVWQELDWFDERYHSYCSDSDLGIRAKRMGIKLVIIRSSLRHHGGRSTRFTQIPGRREFADRMSMLDGRLLRARWANRHEAFTRPPWIQVQEDGAGWMARLENGREPVRAGTREGAIGQLVSLEASRLGLAIIEVKEKRDGEGEGETRAAI